jgi:hypothetical protein
MGAPVARIFLKVLGLSAASAAQQKSYHLSCRMGSTRRFFSDEKSNTRGNESNRRCYG